MVEKKHSDESEVVDGSGLHDEAEIGLNEDGSTGALPHDPPGSPKVGEDNLHTVFGHAEGEVKGPDPEHWGSASAEMFDIRMQFEEVERKWAAEQAAKAEQPPKE